MLDGVSPNQEILSLEGMKRFFNHMGPRKMRKESILGGALEASDHLIRTGEKLGSKKDKVRITNFLKREIQSAAEAGVYYYPGYTSLSEMAALYRIFTEKPIKELLNVGNKITEEFIIKNLEDTIKEGMKDGYLISSVYELVRFRILTEDFKIVPGKGIIFPEDK